MYCGSCGNPVGENDVFCAKCGAPSRAGELAKGGNVAAGPASESVRQELVLRLERAAEQFKDTAGYYEQLQYLEARVEWINTQLSNRVGFVIAGLLCWLLLVIGFSFIQMSLWKSSQSGGEADGFSVAFGIVVCLASLLPVLFIVRRRRSLKAGLADTQDAIKETYGVLYDHYLAVPDKFLEFEQSSPSYIWALHEVIRLRRAYTLQEAINLVENLKWQDQVLTGQEQIIKEARDAKRAAMAAAILSI